MKVSVPNQGATRLVDFPRLDGGLNLREIDYRLDANQSSNMKNLWWQDGVLQCRDGQVYIYGPSEAQMQETLAEGVEPWVDLGTGYTCAGELFWDHAFFHIGSKLYYMDVNQDLNEDGSRDMLELLSGVPENRGTFFRYNEWLFYKNRGGFYRIDYDPDSNPAFSVVDVTDIAYTPVTIINASPVNGSGSTYQPENRLSAKKTIWYNAAETTETAEFNGDGAKTAFSVALSAGDQLTGISRVYVDSALMSVTAYAVSGATVTFLEAPASGRVVQIEYQLGVTAYQLPVTELDSIDEVIVDGVSLTEGDGYTVDLQEGLIIFKVAPPVTTPATNNTVEITYSKANADALKSIMDCPYATVYGSNSAVSIVLGGCTAQPNVFFWSGNDTVGMNAGYWPMSFYNLAGDAEESITGFGKQYGELIILNERSVGKSAFDIETVDDRDAIALTYVAINDKIGCDLPWTIQLIDNNIVFCNTSGGVYILRDSSAAYENNIECVSSNVNGTNQRPGLLRDVRLSDANLVCGFDDDNRYWLCANSHVYFWDYQLSTWKDPSWFYATEVRGVAYFRSVDTAYHLDESGRVTRFERCFSDYNGPIEKLYQFPPQNFGTYDRLKDVLYCIFAVRSDTDTEVHIQYQTDYETRDDPTNIKSMSWRLAPRNLAYRCLSVQKFTHVARRRPGCRHVRHFAMRLSNNTAAQDLAILSAQIYYRYTGRDR